MIQQQQPLTHAHTRTHTHTHTHTQTHTHTHKHTQAHTHTHANTDTQTTRRTEIHTRKRPDAKTRRHADTQTHRQTDAKTHRHTDTQPQPTQPTSLRRRSFFPKFDRFSAFLLRLPENLTRFRGGGSEGLAAVRGASELCFARTRLRRRLASRKRPRFRPSEERGATFRSSNPTALSKERRGRLSSARTRGR